METLNNGATIIEQRGEVVLAKWRGEFVTWVVNSKGDAFWGNYHRGLASAVTDFEERASKYAEREARRAAYLAERDAQSVA